jgi:predicted DNA-binding protein (MmcQ/YjbR family)
MAGGSQRDRVIAACGAKPGSAEDYPFGDEVAVFKVAGRMFALVPLGQPPGSVSLKCDPHLAAGLRDRYPAVTPGYHLNKRHWNTVIVDGSVPEQMIRDMIEDSYDLVVGALPESRRVMLGWQRDGPA